MVMESLILASQSPARRMLLESVGWPFEVVVSDVSEDDHPERDPVQRARVLARLKAQNVAAARPGRFIVACDTLVVAPDGTLLEKPVDADDARRMLRLQSGGTTIVHSALCVALPDGTLREELSSSAIRYVPLTEELLEWWIASGAWQERSGACQIDGPGQLLIESLEGDWSAVVGLPLPMLGRILREAGWEWAIR